MAWRILGLMLLPMVASAEEPPKDRSALIVALALGGSVGPLQHPASPLPPTLGGVPREVPERDVATRVSSNVQLALSQFFDVRDLWFTGLLDWYLSGDLRALSLRVGAERQFALSSALALGVGAYGATAEVSMGTGELTFFEPQTPGGGGFNATPGELRASQWRFGLGGTVSLLLLTRSPVYARLQAGYTQYFDEADHFEERGKDYTPEGFSVSLSGPSVGLFVGIRL